MSVVQVPAVDLMPHQQALIAAWETGARWLIALWHRRAGKGIGALSLLALAAWQRVGTYVYVSPTAVMSRRNLWSGLTTEGESYLRTVFPAECIAAMNENEMRLDLGNGSVIRFIGADDPDRLRGLTVLGAVLDEYATFQTDEAYRVLRPILQHSGGWLLVTSTPCGRNHYADLVSAAQADEGWHVSVKTIHDTVGLDGAPLFPAGFLERELAQGQSQEWLDQEYLCSFVSGLVGSYYADLIRRAEQEGRITDVPYLAGSRVTTAWDLGIADATAIVFVQPAGLMYQVFDALSVEGKSLTEIIALVHNRGYVFDRHLGPHDLRQREYTTGTDRLTVAARLGVRFEIVESTSVAEGIDAVRRLFPRLVFDQRRCARLLEALAEYTKAWDEAAKMYKPKPKHDWTSHYADALRYLALGGVREPKPPGWRPAPAKNVVRNPFAKAR